MQRRLPFPLLPAWLRWAGVAGLAVAIFVLSIVLAPPEQVAPKPSFAPLDKWRHFLAYAALGGSLAYATAETDRSRARRALLVLVATGVYGVGLEVGQSLRPARYMSLGDALANTVGALLSLAWFAVESRVELVAASEWPSRLR